MLLLKHARGHPLPSALHPPTKEDSTSIAERTARARQAEGFKLLLRFSFVAGGAETAVRIALGKWLAAAEAGRRGHGQPRASVRKRLEASTRRRRMPVSMALCPASGTI